MNLLEVLPSVAFPVASGPLNAVGNILHVLKSTGHMRMLVTQSSPSEAMAICNNPELRDAKSLPLDHDPFISSKIRIFAEIDGQSVDRGIINRVGVTARSEYHGREGMRQCCNQRVY